MKKDKYMDNNTKYLLIGIGITIYGYISHIRYKKWHRRKIGFDNEWTPVLIKSKGLILTGIVIIIIQILRMIDFLE